MTSGASPEALSAGELHPTRRTDSILAMPHVMAALTATLLLCATLTAIHVYANQFARKYIHVIAPRIIYQKNYGVTLQREAFRHDDLLPVYGSSELVYAVPNRATEFFRHYPTGFAIFPIGERGVPLLVTVQSLAAVGEELRGKRVAIFVSPTFFLNTEGGVAQITDTYSGTFSRLHAGELAYSSSLSFALKQSVARRMLVQASTLEQHPVLRMALHQLADGSPSARIRYYALLPIGKLQNLFLRLQDGGRVLMLLALRPPLD